MSKAIKGVPAGFKGGLYVMFPLDTDRAGMVSTTGVVGEKVTFSADGTTLIATEGETTHKLVAAILPEGAPDVVITPELMQYAVKKLEELEVVSRQGAYISLAGLGDAPQPPRRTPAPGTIVNE